MSRRALISVLVAVDVVAVGAWLIWDRLYRERPQPASITSDMDEGGAACWFNGT